MLHRMKYIGLLTTLLMVSKTNAQPMTAKEIADRSFDATRLAGSEARSTMTIVDSKGRKRVRQVAQVTKLYDGGATEKKLIRFLSPADVKGTGMLTYDYDDRDDDMWLYMPALRKTRRIVSSEKSKSFMGSEFSYADITPPNLDDFSYTEENEATVDGINCRVVSMIPEDDDIMDENGFSKRIIYVGKEDFVLRKAVYYDLDGEPHKELKVSNIVELDPENHKYRAKLMKMVNLQNDRQSILAIDQIAFSPNVKDEYFTTRYLERE